MKELIMIKKKKENPVCFSLIDSTLGKTQLDFTLTHIILIKRKKKKEYKSTKFTTSEYGQHYEIFWKINERNLTLHPLPPVPRPICCFSKNVSSKERLNPWFFVTFNIIISHTFPENSIEIPEIVQKIWTISLSILAIWIDFNQIFGFFGISLWQRN